MRAGGPRSGEVSLRHRGLHLGKVAERGKDAYRAVKKTRGAACIRLSCGRNALFMEGNQPIRPFSGWRQRNQTLVPDSPHSASSHTLAHHLSLMPMLRPDWPGWRSLCPFNQSPGCGCLRPSPALIAEASRRLLGFQGLGGKQHGCVSPGTSSWRFYRFGHRDG